MLNAGVNMRKTMMYGGTKTRKNKWFDEECEQARKENKALLRKCQAIDKAADPQGFWDKKVAYCTARKAYQRIVKSKKDEFRQKHMRTYWINKERVNSFGALLLV